LIGDAESLNEKESKMRQIQLAIAAVLLTIVGLTLGRAQDQKIP